MEVKEMKISDLKQADYNPRKISEKQLEDLKKSLTNFGFIDPVIVNISKSRKNVIVGGHQRVKAWEQLGNSTVPCVFVDLTPKKEKELNVRLNQNGGEFDYQVLLEEYSQEELLDFGFSAVELAPFQEDNDLFDIEDAEDDESAPEPEEEPKGTDDDYSVFEMVMLHNDKIELLTVLREIKDAENLEKLSDSMMSLVDKYKRNK